MAGRPTRTEAVVLRSLRFGEADRILHLYTAGLGRLGAIAKGVRRTTSRFGGRLEPLGHIEVMLHHGRGELATVSGVDLVRSHREVREEPYRLGVGLIGAEAMLRLFHEQEANARAFGALTRFLDLLDELPAGAPAQASLDPLGLSFQLKLLWLAGYLPHVGSCAECGAAGPLAGYSPRAGGVVCRACSVGSLALCAEGIAGIAALVRRPLADAGGAGLTGRAAREVLGAITSSYEYHGGFRLRTLSA